MAITLLSALIIMAAYFLILYAGSLSFRTSAFLLRAEGES